MLSPASRSPKSNLDPHRIQALLAKLIVFRSLAVTAFLVAVAGVAYYPLGWEAPTVLLAAYALVLAWRPQYWLYVLPASLPLLNLYPWTGWLYIEEFDLVVLATLAVGYWRASPAAASVRLTAGARLAFFALILSYLASAALALNETVDWRWTSAINYNTPLNGLRVLKGVLWPLCLLPLLTRTASIAGFEPTRALGRAMLAGLLAASFVVVWERWAFPGLMNFSSDYRAVGPFYEAHVGGAALDAFLALSLPFALVFLLQARRAAEALIGAAVVASGAYASFATFSRGLYLGIASAAAVIAATRLFTRAQPQSGFRLAALSVVFLVSGLLAAQVFSTGGYRTLAAVLGAYAAAVYFGGSTQRASGKAGFALAFGAAVLTVAMTVLLPKGAYVAYGLGALLAMYSLVRVWLGRPDPLASVVCAWLAVAAIAIGWHWGGATAMQDAALAVCVAVALALYNRSASGLLWINSIRTATLVTAGMLMLAVAVPIAGNYFMRSRVQSTSQDLKARESHWMESVAIRGDEWPKPLLGAGLGAYAERYYWHNEKAEFPGVIIAATEGSRSFLRLGGARNTPDLLRVAQRVPVAPYQTLTVELTARSAGPKTQLRIDVCEKWLLYIERCTEKANPAAAERRRVVAALWRDVHSRSRLEQSIAGATDNRRAGRGSPWNRSRCHRPAPARRIGPQLDCKRRLRSGRRSLVLHERPEPSPLACQESLARHLVRPRLVWAGRIRMVHRFRVAPRREESASRRELPCRGRRCACGILHGRPVRYAARRNPGGIPFLPALRDGLGRAGRGACATGSAASHTGKPQSQPADA